MKHKLDGHLDIPRGVNVPIIGLLMVRPHSSHSVPHGILLRLRRPLTLPNFIVQDRSVIHNIAIVLPELHWTAKAPDTLL
jgi:hypothetical protein